MELVIDLGRLWDIVTMDLAPLPAQVEELLSGLTNGPAAVVRRASVGLEAEPEEGDR